MTNSKNDFRNRNNKKCTEKETMRNHRKNEEARGANPEKVGPEGLCPRSGTSLVWVCTVYPLSPVTSLPPSSSPPSDFLFLSFIFFLFFCLFFGREGRRGEFGRIGGGEGEGVTRPPKPKLIGSASLILHWSAMLL